MIKISTKLCLLLALTMLLASATGGYGDPTPAPSGESGDIFGKWWIAQLSSGTLNQAIQVEITNNQITFNGCNQNWASFEYNPTTKVYKVSDFASTRKGCPDDQDSLIATAIKNARRVFKRNGVIIFESVQGVEVLRLTFNNSFPGVIVNPNPPVVNPPVVYPPTLPPVVGGSSEIWGTFYVYQVAGATINQEIRVTISSTTIGIKGCNSMSGSLSYNSANFAATVGLFKSTLAFCPNSQDNIVTAALSKVARIYSKNGYIIFEDNQGLELIRLASNSPFPSVPETPYVPPQPQPVGSARIFGSFFVTQFASGSLNQQISIEISSNEIRFKGCNTNWATFTYDQASRTFTVGDFASTYIYCANDQDRLITAAIKSATRIYELNGVIVFENAQGVQVLTLGTSSPFPSVPVPPVQPPQPVGSARIFGSFFVTQLSSGSLNQEISIEISSNEIRIKGCNTLWARLTYDQASRTFTVGPFASTKIGCPPGAQDTLITAAISSATRIYELNGVIIFENAQGVQVLTLGTSSPFPSIPVPPVQPPYVPNPNESSNIFSTFYVSQFSSGTINQQISIQFTNTEIIIQGCNTLRASFQYNPTTKQFTISNFASTRKFCANDQDALITSAIASATRVYSLNGVIVFESAQGVQVLTLTSSNPFPSIPVTPYEPPVVIPPYQPPVVVPPQPQPPIFLPGVSSTSLKGTYFFKAVSSDLATIVFNFDDDYIQFEGCNVQRLPYAAYTDGVFCLLQGGSSTLRACNYDIDRSYVQLLTTVTRFVKTDAGFDLYNQDTLVGRLEQKVRNRVVLSNVINGGYQLDIKGVDVYVSQSSIGFFGGCNSITIGYSLYNGQISFGAPGSTRRFCDNDYDAVYSTAITRGVTLKQIPEGFALLDAYGYETIRFVSFVSTQNYDCKCFGGNYKLVLPNGGIRLKVDNGQFTLQGCNTFAFTFTLSDNGNIVFKAPSGSRATCETDYDSAFLFAILKAQSIAVVGNNIIFFDGNGLEIVRANNFEQSSGSNVVTVIDPKSPVVPTVQKFFPDGNYRFTILRSSFKAINLTITKGSISWRGCNIFNMNYIASSDGTVKFSSGPSTKIACSDDSDNFYVDALLSIVKYSEMKGMITFYDANGKSVVSFVSDFGVAPPQPVNPPVVVPPVIAPPVLPPTPVRPNPPVQRPEFKPISEAIISLKGKYKFQLPKFHFDIIDSSFVFKGCDTYRIPCAYKNANILFGQPIAAGNKQCNGGLDSFFVNLIPQIINFKKENSIFTFFSALAQPLFSANPIVNKNQNTIPGLTGGSYQTELPSTDVEFDDKNLFFTGCTKNTFGYEAKNTGTLTVQGPNQACTAKNFDAYSGAVRGASKYRSIDGGFILEDQNGNEKGRCLKK